MVWSLLLTRHTKSYTDDWRQWVKWHEAFDTIWAKSLNEVGLHNAGYAQEGRALGGSIKEKFSTLTLAYFLMGVVPSRHNDMLGPGLKCIILINNYFKSGKDERVLDAELERLKPIMEREIAPLINGLEKAVPSQV